MLFDLIGQEMLRIARRVMPALLVFVFVFGILSFFVIFIVYQSRATDYVSLLDIVGIAIY